MLPVLVPDRRQMSVVLSPVARRQARLSVALVTLLASMYMLTYSGRIESGDSLLLVDAVGSVVNQGDTRLDLAVPHRPPPPQLIQPGQAYPLPAVNAEVLQLVLAAPLYWAAQRLPGVGLVHAVYLFNVLVCALAGGVMFLYGRALGYSERTATLAGLLLGLATIVWPYSKSFFQEPAALLLLLLAGLLLERWRAAGGTSAWLLVGAALAVTGAMLNKNAAALALPALLVIALPGLRGVARARLTQYAVFAVGLVAALFVAGFAFNVFVRFERLFATLGGPQDYALTALHSYLLSPGGSVWGTSPALLLAVPGAWLLLRSGRWRYPLALALALGSFAFVYAVRQGPDWFGGLSWPPRFLVPTIPFALLCALPAIERLAHGRLPLWARASAGVLIAFSVWVQFTGVSLWWGEYTAALPPEAEGLIEWGGGLNDLRYVRWVLVPTLWQHLPLDFAWVRVSAPGWAVVFGGLAAASALMLRWSAHSCWRLAVVGLPLIFVAAAWGGLRAIYQDALYLGDRPQLHALLPLLEAAAGPEAVALVADPEYMPFLLNYARFASPRLVTLPYHPGERSSPEQTPQVVSDNPIFLLEQNSAPLIHALAQTRDYLWLVASSGPYVPWAVRPVERFMAAHYFVLGEQESAPDARLIAYSAASAPDPFAFRGPERLSDVLFGRSLRLVGFDLPRGTVYEPGAALPISLYWQAEARVTKDYTVAWFLRDATGWEVQQGMDSEPVAGFMPTSVWEPGVPVRDNRALRVPADLAPGQYQLWVVLYDRDAHGSVANLPAVGADTRDGYIGVLPATITVTMPG
ncbi:MAG: hypothetical protein ACUVSX_15640 [Aggregatilineales bacterium]